MPQDLIPTAPATQTPPNSDPAPGSLPLANKAHEAYAIARSIGYGMREAVRRAGGKPENGTGTKWEQTESIIARIRYLTRYDEDVILEKRRRIEDRLNEIAFGDLLEFCEFVEQEVFIGRGKNNEPEYETRRVLVIDWQRLTDEQRGRLIEEIKVNPKTGEVIGFKRSDTLQAIAQLRDLHGFKAPAKTELTGKDGEPLTLDALIAASMKPKENAA